MSSEFKPFTESIDLLMRLPLPVLFRYIAEVDPARVVRIGFIAEELAEIDKRFISYATAAWSTEPVMYIQYDALVALLFNSVRQLTLEIAALRKRLDDD